MGIDEALQEACPTRMRGVLMTSATIILALSPAALGLGADSSNSYVAGLQGFADSGLVSLKKHTQS
jgi:HAE1 family hydrophobic/amphiphilic exporter-1